MQTDDPKNAREIWWKALIKQGDPSLRANLTWEAFEAGYRAGAGAETERCAAIVSLARFGEIDGDFRSIIHRIEMNSPATKEG
jgi:hypothetical protein